MVFAEFADNKRVDPTCDSAEVFRQHQVVIAVLNQLQKPQVFVTFENLAAATAGNDLDIDR